MFPFAIILQGFLHNSLILLVIEKMVNAIFWKAQYHCIIIIIKTDIMKNTVKLFSLFFIMVLFSCSKETALDVTTENEISGQSVASKAAANKSTVAILEKPGGFPDGDFLEITGASSTIHRNKNGITVNFKTDGLIPGNAYTLWFVIFGDAPGPPYSTHAAGHIAGGSGKGNFSGHISVGDIFNNPLTAEVHMALRSHGPAQPGMIPSQIQTFDDGCNPSLTLPEGPGRIWPDSDVVGYCANIQVAVHPSVN